MNKLALVFLMLAATTSFAEPVKVFIIDTGLDINHPAFENTKIHCREDRNCKDEHGHGTHIASLIIGGEWVKNRPTKSVCADIELYPCKYTKDDSEAPRSIDLVESTFICIKEAVKLKVDIIVYASSGYGFNEKEYNIIKAAWDNKIIFATAAGNGSDSLEESPMFPAMYRFTYRVPEYSKYPPLGNVYVVGALTKKHERFVKSNYGPGLMWERGTQVMGALPNKKMGIMEGTSQATALFVNKKLLQLCGH